MEAGIESIEGAQYLTGLSTLDFFDNLISDLTPLAELNNLSNLFLGQNLIEDVSPLAGLNGLTELYLTGNQISDVTSLSELTNITELVLNSNQISDFSALSVLSEMNKLYLADNQISDISALSSFTNITEAYLYQNIINDIPDLSGMDNLIKLSLSDNQIEVVPNLSYLENLSSLGLAANLISDVTPLAGLTNVSYLYLQGNRITDVSSFLEYPECNQGNTLFLYFNNDTIEITNPLSLEAIEVQVPILRTHGFESFWCNDEPNLNAACYPNPVCGSEDISCNGILSWTGSNQNTMHEVYLGTAEDNLVYLGDGEQTSENLNSIYPELLPSTEYWWQVKSITGTEELWSGKWNFTTGSTASLVPDSNFRERINLALEQPVDYEPTILDLNNLTGHLSAINANIYSIEGAQYLTGLSSIHLGENNITDVSKLANLTNLTQLLLQFNFINDISDLANLENLTSLVLHNNLINDIYSLSNMTELTELRLYSNEIENILPLANLTNLTDLRLEKNQITELSALTNMIELNWLTLYDNPFTDIYPLVENQGLGFEDNLFLHFGESYNFLSKEAIEVYLPILQARDFESLFVFDYILTQAPCYPQPIRDEENIGYNTMLSWFGTSDGYYEVFLGSSPSEMESIGFGEYISDNRYEISPDLLPTTEYWWRVHSTLQYWNDNYWSGLWHFTTGNSEVEIDEDIVENQDEINLSNYPNPFKLAASGRGPGTTISFQLSGFRKQNSAEIEIYNLKGQKIKSFPVTLSGVEGRQTSSVNWNGSDKNNNPVSSGVYLYKLKVDGKTKAMKKCLLLK